MEHIINENIQRIIEESVPGKQITIAHVIASPVKEIFKSLDIEDEGAIGILTLSPPESVIIAADIATKSSNVKIGFLDRFTGALVLGGDVESVETALENVNNILSDKLKFNGTKITRT